MSTIFKYFQKITDFVDRNRRLCHACSTTAAQNTAQPDLGMWDTSNGHCVCKPGPVRCSWPQIWAARQSIDHKKQPRV